MAKSTRRSAKSSATPARAPEAAPRDRIIDALMVLLADRPIGGIGLAEVAAEAGVTLATLRENFDGKLAILAGFSRRVDLAVLEGGAADSAGEPRDRLFEAMMRRFDALAPYKSALRSLAQSARRDPFLARSLHRIARRSQMWTLVAANIHKGGLLGRVAVEGAVMVYVDAMRVWLDDDDPDQARTMAALDRSLRRGERAMKTLGDVCSFLPRLAEKGREARGRGGRRREASGEAEA